MVRPINHPILDSIGRMVWAPFTFKREGVGLKGFIAKKGNSTGKCKGPNRRFLNVLTIFDFFLDKDFFQCYGILQILLNFIRKKLMVCPILKFLPLKPNLSTDGCSSGRLNCFIERR